MSLLSSPQVRFFFPLFVESGSFPFFIPFKVFLSRNSCYLNFNVINDDGDDDDNRNDFVQPEVLPLAQEEQRQPQAKLYSFLISFLSYSHLTLIIFATYSHLTLLSYSLSSTHYHVPNSFSTYIHVHLIQGAVTQQRLQTQTQTQTLEEREQQQNLWF